LALAGLTAGTQYPRRSTRTEIRGISSETYEERNRRRGLKLFSYPDGFTCWARNQKNADRKHNICEKQRGNCYLNSRIVEIIVDEHVVRYISGESVMGAKQPEIDGL
jgi:hypothetical protein